MAFKIQATLQFSPKENREQIESEPEVPSLELIVTWLVNTLRPRQDGRHFADDIFKCISLSENVRISINFSLKFIPKGQIKNIAALVQIMAWHRPGDKPFSETMMVRLLPHICLTRLQWVEIVKPTLMNTRSHFIWLIKSTGCKTSSNGGNRMNHQVNKLVV